MTAARCSANCPGPARIERDPDMTNVAVTYAVDDEFSNKITCGLASYDAAIQVARRYLSAHRDAPGVRIYEDTEGGEGWDLTRAEVLG